MADTFEAIVAEAVDTTSTWTSMVSDRELCQRKMEGIRAAMTFYSSAEDIAIATNMVMVLSYTIHQYDFQLSRFPVRLADLRQRCMMLTLSPEEIRRARPQGLN